MPLTSERKPAGRLTAWRGERAQGRASAWLLLVVRSVTLTRARARNRAEPTLWAPASSGRSWCALCLREAEGRGAGASSGNGGEQVPCVWHALERMFASIGELDARAGNQILDRRGNEHLVDLRMGGDSASNVHGDPAHVVAAAL